ncbi:helix-turn-helix transcriptional regulator [Bengtsoniella intestinalis]|uniref:helix-turn-helix domain-containing protein n=1 Tax=Bengtsoniella intestinalis TaxID=3073143 RepID=UPI00391F1A23
MDNRIKELRLALQMNQTQLADALNTSKTSVNLWEQGRRLPPVETLLRIATFFHVSLDYLLRRSEARIESKDLTQQIDVCQLPALHGAPVWLERQDIWVLVDGIGQILRRTDGTAIPFAQIDEPVWGMPPVFARPLTGEGMPLTRNEISSFEELWVEPISPDPLLRNELRGWYTVYQRYAANEFGNRFYLDRYGATWLAFEDSL